MTALERCRRCGQDIISGRVAGGWSNAGPGASYHAVLEECGPPLPLEPLPEPRLSGGRGPWPTDLGIEQLLDNHERPPNAR